MKSCIYKGRVRHQRYLPRAHAFTYSLFMMYVDLDELPTLFNKYLLWAVNKSNLASFHTKDHHGDGSNLAHSIRSLVLEKTGQSVEGPIRLLTHFRYFGYVFNPLSMYFCFNSTGKQVTHVVAEVSNTPWKEQHCYVISNKESGQIISTSHKKEFHVSPFMNMDMQYHWSIHIPDDHMNISIENWSQDSKVFDASIFLKKVEINSTSLRNVLYNFPLMTLKVSALIHFEALKLWIKGIRYVPHPKN